MPVVCSGRHVDVCIGMSGTCTLATRLVKLKSPTQFNINLRQPACFHPKAKVKQDCEHVSMSAVSYRSEAPHQATQAELTNITRSDGGHSVIIQTAQSIIGQWRTITIPLLVAS